ncbi:hypothetical protein FRC02_010764 [Tulasnella sp. 418]|nr:hypothetical protein FRC02_010764 [Tulasnella sp. 418]
MASIRTSSSSLRRAVLSKASRRSMMQMANQASARKQKTEGDISSVFVSLAGEAPPPLPKRFSDLKKTLVPTTHDQERLAHSWRSLLDALKVEVAEIQEKSTTIVPEVSFNDMVSTEEWKKEVRKRGVVIVRNAIDDAEVLGWKEQLRDYIKANPQVKGFPADNKQVFELYWSLPQLAARGHPNALATQRAILQLFHADPSAEISFNHPVTYADRLRMRLPGDSKFALGPHIDGGSLERWEDPVYRNCYREVLQGRWQDLDMWDCGRRVNATTDLYDGPGQCGVLRGFQGWTSLSTTGPNEGALRVFPLIKEATAYLILRPFFQPTLNPSHPDFFAPDSWKLNLESTDFPNSPMGRAQELSTASHPHLRLDEGGMVSIKSVNPGDMVFWHCDGIHAVEKLHAGTGDSSVFYIPSVPLTKKNAEYLVRQRETFLHGYPAPDFPGGDGENGFKGVATAEHIRDDTARRAMGLMPFVTGQGTVGEQKLLKEVNRILGF